MSADPSDRITELLSECYDDPDLFNSAFLGRPGYWSRQREIAESLCRYRCTIAYTGNAVGKDYLVGGIVPWWMFTRRHSLVVVTGPSQTVLGSVTWKEIRSATDPDPNPDDPLARFPLGVRLSQGIKASPLTVTIRDGWQALGYSTTSVERASGQHNRRLLVIIEEASGVDDEIWDAIESLKYVCLLAIGNPIRAEGRFVELIRQAGKDAKDGVPHPEACNAIRVSSRESPDAHLRRSERGLADHTWISACERNYGRESLWVRSHIDAVIPETSADRLIPADWLDRACSTDRPPIRPFDPLTKTRRISCDLGEGVGRDSTAICVRDDHGVLHWRAGSALGLLEAATEIAGLKAKWGVPDERISYDKLGIGRDFPQYLRRNGVLAARAYAGSGEARDKKRFANARTEAAWNLRTRLNTDWSRDTRDPLATKQPPFHIPADENWPMLREELDALTYDLVGNKTRLISKEDLCAELGRSPDRSDALLQSFAFG